MRFLLIFLLSLLAACGGGGEGPSSSTTLAPTPTVLANQVTVSSDITKNAYSTSYTATAQTPVIDDKCLLTASSVSYPEAYRGAFPLPQVKGSFANTNVALSITPKDDWVNSMVDGNPNMNIGCVNSHKTAFISTLERIKALGVTYLTIYNSTRLDDASNPTVLTNYFISDSDLVWMGQQAINNGIKIRFAMQVDIWDIKGNNVIDAIDKLSATQQQAWATNFLRLYKDMMLHEASVMSRIPNGFDAIKLDWGYFDHPVFSNSRISVINSINELSQAIRAIYNWKQWINHFTVTDFSISGALLTGANLLVGSIDLVEVMPQNARVMTVDEENNLSASFIKNFYNVLPDWILSSRKPIFWNIQVQSHRTFFTKGWIEDCCITPSYSGSIPDFSVQAIGIEGMLEMIHDRTQSGDVVTDSVNINSYWWTDSIKPYQSLPEISQSIRNKPAESIVYQWWKK
jgi:hypothetical protein